MEHISVIIPSRNEKYLNITIKDLLAKAKGKLEIIVVVEGEPFPKQIEGVKYILNEQPIGMKYAINKGAEIATGKYIMKIDAHCIVAEGFDEQLKKDHQPNWIQIPRRCKLDEEKWEAVLNEYIDYEYWILPTRYKPTSLHGFKWRERTEERKDILLDDTLTFQGSFWFMERAWWDKMNFMKDEGFNELHAQEACYLGTETWYAGGRVITNKNTWYAHLHKKKEDGRGYHMDAHKQRECYKYSYKHFVLDNKDKFISLIEKFEPLPNWPKNWRQILWKN